MGERLGGARASESHVTAEGRGRAEMREEPAAGLRLPVGRARGKPSELSLHFQGRRGTGGKNGSRREVKEEGY